MRVSGDERTGSAMRILDIAQHLIQVRGFNAVSYADVADILDVTKASLHYHFPAKTRLGEALIDRYHRDFQTALAALDSKHTSIADRLAAYVAIYTDVMRAGRVCLCFMLATDYESSPPSMQQRLTAFFAMTEAWLAATLATGQDTGEIDFLGTPEETAQTIIATLEGAMITCRANGGLPRYESMANRALVMAGVCPAEGK